MNEPRTVRLRRWMSAYSVTYRWLGEQIGISGQAVRYFLTGETIPIERHRQLVELGVPVDLLPVALDVPSGPHRKIPTFPGLSAQGKLQA